MTLEIYLVRHAQSEINHLFNQWTSENKKVCGRNQWSELTKKGVQQSIRLGEYLEGSIIHDFYSSPAIRAQQTTRYCMQAMNQKWPLYEIDERLAELSQGKWEGQIDYKVRPSQIRRDIESQGPNFRPLGGESQSDVYERMRNFIEEEIITKYSKESKSVKKYDNKYNKKAIIFTHKNALACLLAHLKNFDLNKIHKMKIDYVEEVEVLENKINDEAEKIDIPKEMRKAVTELENMSDEQVVEIIKEAVVSWFEETDD